MTEVCPRVAVVVVTFNSADMLPDLVESLDAGMQGTDWRLVVADNASSDDSAETVRELVPDVVLVETGRNGGYAAGINAAVAAAPPFDAILVLNPDVRLHQGCAARLLETLRAPGVGIAVPRLVDGGGRPLMSMRREPTVMRALGGAVLGVQRAGLIPLLGEIVSRPSLYETAQITHWAEGSTQMISERCWREVGPWDEFFFLYSEETEFDLRARDAGFATRYEPTACATHLTGGSSESPVLWPLLVLNQVRLFRKRHGVASAALFWSAVFLREFTRSLLGRETSRQALRAMCNPARWRQAPGPKALR